MNLLDDIALKIEAAALELLDQADADDDDGVHVGFASYYRAKATGLFDAEKIVRAMARREKEAVLAGASFANEVERLRAHVAALHELLREWCELGDLPSGGYGGTLRYRTEAELGRLA